MSPVAPDPTAVAASLTPCEQDALLAGAPWRRLVVLGDSVAEGIGDPAPGYPDRSWADQLALAVDRVAPGLVYRNLGVRGLESDRILEEQVPAAVRFAPDLAVVSAGGNDILGRRFDPDLTADRLHANRRGHALVLSGIVHALASALGLRTSQEIDDRVAVCA